MRSLKQKLIINFETLHFAYLKAKKGKTFKEKTLRFSFNLEKELYVLEEELCTKTYEVSEYTEFIV